MNEENQPATMRLHEMGYRHARTLIDCGKVNRGSWSFDAADQEKLLGPKGKHVEEYAKHHLGENTAFAEGTRERFDYPCAKDGEVYSRALKAIRSKASKNGHADVYSNAGQLLDAIEMMDDGSTETEQNDNTPAPEKRFMKGIELRTAADGTGPGTVFGYASICNRLSEDLGGFVEKVAPGAFSKVLTNDVRALVNHNPDLLIGRTTSGTARMIEDSVGLRVEIDLPDTTVGRDTAVSIRRGDLTGMSFSFDTGKDSWDWETTPPTRTLLEVSRLYDWGPVAFPAYPETSAAMRSLRAHRHRASPSPTPTSTKSLSLARMKARQRMAAANFPV